MQPNTTHRVARVAFRSALLARRHRVRFGSASITEFEVDEESDAGALDPVVRAPDCEHLQDYPVRMAEAHVRGRARTLAKEFGIIAPKALTDDDKAPFEWCVPAKAASPKGQPLMSCLGAAAQEFSVVALLMQRRWTTDSGSVFDVASHSDRTAKQKKRIRAPTGQL